MSVAAIPELVSIDIANQSDRGQHREENQAVVRHARTQFGDLLVVADGVGEDAVAGSQASRKAADTISSRIEGMPAFFPSEIAVEEAVRQANTELTAMAAMPDCPYRAMGVTLVVALLRYGRGSGTSRPSAALATVARIWSTTGSSHCSPAATPQRRMCSTENGRRGKNPRLIRIRRRIPDAIDRQRNTRRGAQPSRGNA